MIDPRIRRSVLFFVNIAISVAFLALVVMRTNFTGYALIISRLSPALIGFVIAIVIFQMTVISAWRLKMILTVMGFTVKVVHVARVTWCGFFVEQVGAAFITGDIARILLLRKAAINLKTAIEGPLLDRAIGLGTIVVMASFGMPYLWHGLQNNQRHLILAILVAGGIVLMSLVAIAVCSTRWPKMVGASWALSALILSIMTGFARPYSRRRISAVVLLAFATHALNVFAMYLLLGAVGLELSVFTCFMFMPTVFLVSTLPTSISGWGVREGALVIALNNFDFPPEQVIAASVLFGLCVLAASLPGAVIWMSIPRRIATSVDGPHPRSPTTS